MAEPGADVEHRMAFPPRSVYDEGGDEHGHRLGYVTACACGLGFFGDKDLVWKLLAGHMVMADPRLRAIAERVRAEGAAEQ
jgi:hypothetical protein